MTVTLTQEQLNELWTAIEYTRGTIGSLPQRSTEKPEYVYIHGGRAHQSMAYLNEAQELINQLKSELK